MFGVELVAYFAVQSIASYLRTSDRVLAGK